MFIVFPHNVDNFPDFFFFFMYSLYISRDITKRNQYDSNGSTFFYGIWD